MTIDTSTLKAIAYAMENQTESYVFCTADSKVYTTQEAEDLGLGSDICIQLPQWSSAQGYRLMCMFASSREGEQKRLLENALESKGRTFKRFREAVAQLGIQEDWHLFKDKRMHAYIAKWLSNVFPYDECRDSDELDEGTLLLLDYDIVHQDELSGDVTAWLDSYWSDKPFEKHIASYFKSVRAYTIYKDNDLCGILLYGTEDRKARVLCCKLFAENDREGLERLLWDHFCRGLERQGIQDFLVENGENSPLPECLAGLKMNIYARDMLFHTYDWNSVTYESEMIYVL